MTPVVSVVIPAYNEEQNVAPVSQAVRAALELEEDFEIIFVDDGSRDGTAVEVRKLTASDPRIRLIRFGRNFGQQAALLAGLESMRGEVVITLDCDLQQPPELIPKMLSAWRSGAKVVQMVRMSNGRSGLFKSASSDLFYRVINLLSEVPVVPGAADYQLLDRTVVDAVLQFRDRAPFLRGLVAWLGFPAERMEYTVRERASGQSGYTLRKMCRLAFQAVTGLSAKPLRLALYLGLAAAAFAMVYALFAVIAMLEGKTVQGWTSVVVIVALLGAIQLVCIGILGEYLARIHEQTRGTPRYVIIESDDGGADQTSSFQGFR